MKTKSEQWIVGVDLRQRSDGAVRFAGWLWRAMAADVRPTLHGVHVIESAQLKALRQFGSRAEIERRVAGEVELTIERAGAAEAFERTAVIEHRRVDVHLAELAEGIGATTLLVGRVSGVDQGGLIRLGTVARRLVRALRRPVIVVPPDLDPAQLGPGPVVLAANAGESSVGALRFAADMARKLGRELVCVHVIHVPLDYAQLYWSDAALAKHRDEQSARAFRGLKQWLTEHDHEDTRIDLRAGSEADAILGAASELRAPLLVCGSRRLGGLERVVMASVSVELAAHAPIPVAVVPPEYGE